LILQNFISQLNDWGQKKLPFLFCIDFEMQQPFAVLLNEINSKQLLYNFNGITNETHPFTSKNKRIISKQTVSYKSYHSAFNQAKKELHHGNSYLMNLTFPTQIETDGNLLDIYYSAKAKYKLWLNEQFVFFSPETFIEIKENQIITHPMKGTIDASIPYAADTILSNKKEMAEHATIVDLLRNDLSMVAENVQVVDYRYLTYLKTSAKNLIQVSSAISGNLEDNSHEKIGDILFSMLPAGSVSGAPKAKTIELIQKIEKKKRGYFTGISGIFDGKNLDSCVNIRFIENNNGEYYYRSGGGITINSHANDEYNEMIDKVYVPFA